MAWDSAAVRRLVRRVKQKVTVEARDASLDLEPARSSRSPRATGCASSARAAARDRARAARPGRHRDGARAHQGRRAEGLDRAAGREVSGRPDRQPRRRSSSRSTRTSSSPRPTGSPSARSGWRRPPASTTSRTRPSNPAWHVPNSDWAGDLAGKVIPGGAPRTRSRRAGWASTTAPASTAPTPRARSARPPRTAASGCTSRTSIELYDEVPVGRADLHRLESRAIPRRRREPARVDLLDRHLLPALLQQGGMVVGVANAEGADEDASRPPCASPRTTACSRRGPLDPVPRPRRRLVAAARSRPPRAGAGWRPDPWTCR